MAISQDKCKISSFAHKAKNYFRRDQELVEMQLSPQPMSICTIREENV
jgi:hypothetical protein